MARAASPDSEGPVDDARDAPTPSPGAPWIETRAGGLFFVNALLVAPAATVLVPLLLGLGLRALGVVEGPSRMFDTIPRVADYLVPRVGWLAAPAGWVAWKALGEVERRGPRGWLLAFLTVHLGTLAYTFWRWGTG